MESPKNVIPSPAGPRIRGACLCGEVAFHVADEVEGRLELCHCPHCRKVTGSGFAAGLVVPADAVRFDRGADRIVRFSLPVRDAPPPYEVFFCGVCGSPVPNPSPSGSVVEIPAGSLDAEPGLRVTRHIYGEHRAPWTRGLDLVVSYTGPEIRALRARTREQRPIRTSRLLLRAWRDDDLAPFAEMNTDPRVMEFFPAPLDRARSDLLAGQIRAHLDEFGWGLWAVEVIDGPAFIGFTGLAVPRFTAPFTPCVEIGWRLAAPHWGHGYATEAARAVLDVAFAELEIDDVVALTAKINERSWRVMERLGMRHDPRDDFEHPLIEDGHALRSHVLYRATRD